MLLMLYGLIMKLIMTLVVLFLFISAFKKAGANGKLILSTIVTLLFLTPYITQNSVLGWICYGGKVIFGIGCYLYIRLPK
ncbi:MAG: hypothetical protein KAU46_03025 [Candidatus Aminicenantes bacterium]|nr:hypothetical protein [Candidatus Aminicenantes bacterium]